MTGPTESRINLDDLRIRENSSRGRGRFILLVLLILLVPGAFLAGWILGPRGGARVSGGKIAVRTVLVTTGSGRDSGSAQGFSEGGWIEVPSYHPIYITALTSGRVEELSVLEGSRVTKGQVVARLYDRDLKDSLRLAEADLAEAKAKLAFFAAGYRAEDIAKQEADVSRLREESVLALKILARTEKLVPTGAASQEDLDRDASAAVTAMARLKASEEELRRLRAGFRAEEVAQAEAAVSRAEAARDLARSRLAYVEVKSPADGVVLERFVTPGSYLAPGATRVVSLYDPEDLQVRVDVRQENAGQIEVGQKAEIAVAAAPGRSWRGEVIRVEPLADFKKNTVQAKIRLEETDPVLRPEMICRVRFLSEDNAAADPAAPGTVLVPGSAIREEGGKTFVFVVRKGRVRRTEIRTGEAVDGRFSVAAGLSGGERVVLAPEGLQDGDEVTEAGR